MRPSGYFDLFDPMTVRQVVPAVRLPPDAQYRLTAIVRATVVYLYINGVFMVRGDVERGVAFAGQVGVFAVNGIYNPTNVVFHNFTIGRPGYSPGARIARSSSRNSLLRESLKLAKKRVHQVHKREHMR